MSRLPGFRLALYNVRRFKSPADSSSTVRPIAQFLDQVRPDVICLNEVQIQGFEEMTQQLESEYHWHFFGHVKGSYGNAIGSRFPIVGTREVHLRGGSEVDFGAGTKKLNGEVAQAGELHRIVRGLVLCDLDLGAGVGPGAGGADGAGAGSTASGSETDTRSTVVTVGCTHLDHISIDQRRTQLSHMAEIMAAAGGHPSLVAGDLNTLTRADYSEAQWAKLERRAQANGWRGPEGGGLEILEHAGFTDCYGDVTPGAEGAASQFTAPVDDPQYRIDYCLADAGMLRSLRITSAEVQTSIECSDHFPVLFTFEPKDSGGARSAL